MQIQTLWHQNKVMPSRKQIEQSYSEQGKFVAISPAIFGGWHLWFLVKKNLILTPSKQVSQDALVNEYSEKNKKYKVCRC